jgi:hypothetical protein
MNGQNVVTKLVGGAGAFCVVGVIAVGCGQAPVEQAKENPGESQQGLDFGSPTLQYEGSCAFLKCATCGSAAGACGFGCSDSALRIAVPKS